MSLTEHNRSYRLWDPPTLLSKVYQGYFLGIKWSGPVK